MNEIILEDLDFIINSGINWERFKDKTILITGSTGMLLSYTVYTFLRLNEINPDINVKIIAVVRNIDTAKLKFANFKDSKNLRLFRHELDSPINIEEKIDYIIHGASYASPHHFSSDPVSILKPNVIGTYYLLELAKSKKIKDLLFFSSGAVYGKSADIVSEKDYGYLDPIDIKSCYGESKRIAENMCICWGKQNNFSVKIVRPAHIYGPTMDIKNDSRVFANFTNFVVNNKDIILKSNGEIYRSFCYIADATVAFMKILTEGINGEAYNVGNDDEYMSVKNLAEIFISEFPKKKLKIIHNFQKKDENEDKDKMLMMSTKVKDLGWKCEYQIKEGIRRTVKSYSD